MIDAACSSAGRHAAEKMFEVTAALRGGDPSRLPAIQEALRELGELPAESLLECVRRLDQRPPTLSVVVEAYMDEATDAGDGRIEITEDALAALADEDLDVWLEESLAEMEAFLDGPGSDAPHFLFFTVHRAGGGEVCGQVAAGFISGAAGPTIWERRAFAVPYLLPTLIGWALRVGHVHCVAGPPPRPFMPGPLFRFHPERFRQTRHYSASVASLCPGGRLPCEDDLQRLCDLAVQEVNGRLHETDRRATVDRGVPATVILNGEANLGFAWAKYQGAGRQIFEVPEALAAMMRHTDIEDVPVAVLRLPYPVLYLHFGAQPDLAIEPGWQVDGAYVEHHPEHRLLTFTITACPTDEGDVNCWPAFGEPHFVLSLPQEVAGYDLGTAIDYQLAARLNQLSVEQASAPAMEAAASAAAEAHGMPGESVRIVTERRAATQIEQAHRTAPVLRETMRLAVNVLCFVTAYPDDADVVWPAGVPAKLKRQATEGTPKERARAVSKLESIGYSAVVLCGNRLLARMQMAGFCGDTGHDAVRPHWRRGHWRRQAHGEGKRLRRIVWIMPTIVNAGGSPAHSPDVPGHIYRV